MGTVRIDYHHLEDSAQQASSVSRKMTDYADAISPKVVSPLSSLPGSDSNGYMSSAVSLARKKADSLRGRSQAYAAYARKLTTFVGDARSADTRVASGLDALADRILEGVGFWGKVGHALYSTYCDTIGQTEVGALFDNLVNRGSDWASDKLRKAYEWFSYGDGKYVANIALAVLGTVGAICAAVLSFPVSGVFAAIMAGLAIFSAAVSLVDTIATVIDNVKAIRDDDTDPGLARYYGKTSDVSDFEKKHSTSKSVQTAANVFDISGKVAGIASWIGSGFVKTAADGTKVGTLDWKTIRGNFAGKFKFKGVFSVKTSSLKSADGWNHVPTWIRTADTVNNVSSTVKTALSKTTTAMTTVHDKSVSLKTGLSFFGVGGFSDIVSNLNAFHKWGGIELNPKLSWAGGKVSVSW